jgi:hypothetical protein
VNRSGIVFDAIEFLFRSAGTRRLRPGVTTCEWQRRLLDAPCSPDSVGIARAARPAFQRGTTARVMRPPGHATRFRGTI